MRSNAALRIGAEAVVTSGASSSAMSQVAVSECAMHRIVAELPPIGLADLGSAALLDRVDAKFIVPRALLGEFLSRCAQSYHALELNGHRQGRYQTTYFDSPDLSMYRAHLTGRAVRRKLRARSYLDTAATFLEIKARDNRGRTRKSRVAVHGNHGNAIDSLTELPEELTNGLVHSALVPVLNTNFTRVALVDTARSERMTIDTGITFESDTVCRVFPSMSCIEIKQAHRGYSPALAALSALGQRPAQFSKYCVAVACLVPGIPTHRFKPALKQLHRIERDASA